MEKAIKPAMLAKTVEESRLSSLLSDPEWVVEQKLDGKRLLVKVVDGIASGYNRHGEPTSIPSKVKQAFDHPGFAGTWIFDGELVKDVYHVFDIVDLPTDGWENAALRVRREVLERVTNNVVADNGHIRLVPQFVKNKEIFVNALKKFNTEGFILKRLGAKHQPDVRSYDYLKFKFVDTAEAFITETFVDGKDQAVRLGLYHNGKTVDAGGCKIPMEYVGELNVNDVIEVRYLYATDEFKFYQPVWVRLRDDKYPKDCTTDQLKFTNKTVLKGV